MPLGKNWVYNFLTRHEELEVHRSRTLDQTRKDALDKAILEQWFSLYETTLLKYGIAEDDIYSMNDKGCMKGVDDNARVIVPRE